MAVQFLLLGHVGQVDERPCHDARPAVEEKLEVKPLADSGVELDAHHVVVEHVSCELAAGIQRCYHTDAYVVKGKCCSRLLSVIFEMRNLLLLVEESFLHVPGCIV